MKKLLLMSLAVCSLAVAQTEQTEPLFTRETDSLALVAFKNANPDTDWGFDDGRYYGSGTGTKAWEEGTPISEWKGVRVTTERVSKINFNWNNINLTHIPAEIGNLSQLDTLKLENNQIASISPEIGKLTKLTRLGLSNNNITSIPKEIGNLTNLISLDLENNNITVIPKEIGNLTKLTSLYLVRNQIRILPAEIGKLTNLIDLILTDNYLSEIPVEISNLTKLEWFPLENNRLKTFPEGLVTLLLHIDEEGWYDHTNFISGNHLGQCPLHPLPDVIKTQLDQKLGYEWQESQIHPADKDNAVLEELRRNNYEALKGFPVYGVDWGETQGVTRDECCGQVVALHLENRKITQVPSTIINLSELTSLNLENNLIQTLPWQVSIFPSSVVCNFDGNGLAEGQLPATVIAWLDGQNSNWRNTQRDFSPISFANNNSISRIPLAVHAVGNRLHFSQEVAKGTEIALFDMSGRMIHRANISGMTHVMPPLATGIYVTQIKSVNVNKNMMLRIQ